MIFLKANVSTYYAQDRVDQFYLYLKTEKLSLFNDTVEVGVNEVDDITPSNPMVYLYVFIASVVVFCIIVFFIIAIVLIRKRSFK